jgi:hypothetical protein
MFAPGKNKIQIIFPARIFPEKMLTKAYQLTTVD